MDEPKSKFVFSIRHLFAATAIIGILIGFIQTLSATYAYSTSSWFMWPTRTFGRPGAAILGTYHVLFVASLVMVVKLSIAKSRPGLASMMFVLAALRAFVTIVFAQRIDTFSDILNRGYFYIFLLGQCAGLIICENVLMSRPFKCNGSAFFALIALVCLWLITNEMVMLA